DVELRLAINVIQVYETNTDPYTATGTLQQLGEVGNWWHANRPLGTYPRAIVHFFSGKPVAGGIAWLDVLCNADFFHPTYGFWGGAYGVTQIHANYPAGLWDLFASAHEIGHNSGSPHTHCYTPPIDMCYAGEGGCYSGAVSVPPGGGTIMSYCHLRPGGFANVNLEFHTRCITEQMLPEIASAACLTPVGGPAPTISTVSPGAGTAAGGINLTIAGSNFQAGATVTVGGVPAVVQGTVYPNSIVARTGAHAVGMVDVVLTNPDAQAATKAAGYFYHFTDVPTSHSFYGFVHNLHRNGVTGGCGGNAYCPDASVTRAEMSVFLLRSEEGAAYNPPAATGTVFSDVPAGAFAAAWIEELSDRGITAGCTGGNFCPASAVTREQMAVFLLRTKHGGSYVPPAATGDFFDVPISSPYAPWIEQLLVEGISSGCGGGNFCPGQPVTRGQMAVFLVATFSLP
ncbi:MAG TPA: S-layer homology domain-containing protein, partial [Thermoanaerobaculia bacterium]